MADDHKPLGFVPLRAVTGGTPADPAAALAEIRHIYFRTSKRTIDNDFVQAIALLKSLPDEESRAKAHVYMEGLAEMAREWSAGRSGTVEKGKGGTVRRKRRTRSTQ